MLKKNLKRPGRLLRLILACLLLALAIWQKSWLALGLAIFTLFEAYSSWCVIYQFLGKSECPLESKDSSSHQS